MEPSHQVISIVICTRDRGSRVEATLKSAFSQSYPDFEVILVDQSVGPDTRDAIGEYLAREDFRYIRSGEKGLSRARNLGLHHACGSIVAYSDDDCILPPDWLDLIEKGFAYDPRIAVLFCNVEAAPYDAAKGFIPAYIRTSEIMVTSPMGKLRARGIGAGMAVRKEHILSLGGFDEYLGAGGHFPSCEDGDMAVRAILAGYAVLETNQTHVVHEGFRTWQQGKGLARRNWVGIGAAYVKPLRCRRWDAWVIIAYEAFVVGLWQAVNPVFRLKKPHGLRNFVFFWEGFFRGLFHPMDKSTMLYQGLAQPKVAKATSISAD